jgi:hypothetical protein
VELAEIHRQIVQRRVHDLSDRPQRMVALRLSLKVRKAEQGTRSRIAHQRFFQQPANDGGTFFRADFKKLRCKSSA